jgi:hypothetical protein
MLFSIRFTNNRIAGWTTLFSTLKRLSVDVHRIFWLYPSFNQLQTIARSIGQLKGLAKLHVRADHIRDIREVQKLTVLEHWTDLTLHRGPIEEKAEGPPHPPSSGSRRDWGPWAFHH